ncbi:flagellum-specific ATP synthase [Oryzisolibacter propanilivorax]|uniref:Flagellum-specific ATP synthase n=1 Tax=Oryzisolibacter propanilivorax TaxID=1527607 RepID=A0A1G9V414_9BURK|nr:flagellar protein export ATPase FliI [Oryzisolibacter propanilivorax]SDM66817.1 flagellum-specific ATP synthase [Oryzisolibacter propanilivorax]
MTIETADAWQDLAARARARLQDGLPLETRGTLTRLTGLVLEAAGLRVPVGAQCQVRMGENGEPVLAEVVGFATDKAFLMPAGDVHGLSSGAIVSPAPAFVPPLRLGQSAESQREPDTGAAGVLRLPMGAGLLGRVVDSQGQPLDHNGPLQDVQAEAMDRTPINAMERDPVREPLDTGVRAINALLSVGRGQRLGLFAGSGVGKSVLLGMMARYTQADVIVVGLIGERGREVKEFVEDILGEEDRGRAVVVAAPADAPPLLRMQGAAYATAIAEHFRDQGQHVLLLMDSLTRYAQAQREIALAIGEPPATKGYPPSCFAKLPALVERSGNGLNGVGSITAFYTVLSEGDDQQDPIADAARAILDGHIVLSRALAEGGHYPAIDIEQSASRVMHNVVPREHFELARQFRAVYSRYQKSSDLIQVGAYLAGSDPQLDEAIRLQPGMVAFLQQTMFEAAPMDASVAGMAQALGAG